MALGYRPPESSDSAQAITNGIQSNSGAVATPTTDEVQAVSMAANVASTVSLPVAINVANLSQSLVAQSALAQSNATTVAKPQIVDLTNQQQGVVTYKSVAGDTVEKVAQKYNISAQTIRWANNLTSDALDPGTKLKILPVNGVLYVSKKGDTIDSIAQKYKAVAEQVRLYNNLDLTTVLKPGTQIIIPSGVLPTTEQPGYVAPTEGIDGATNGLDGDYGGGGYSTNNVYTASAGNRYAPGECTWYAYERRMQLGEPVGSFWGNAATWAYYARLAGYRVDLTPAVGAVMQNSGGYYGHVAIVESVDPGVSITISEMNAYRWGGGWDIIDHGTISWSDATSGYYNYIH